MTGLHLYLNAGSKMKFPVSTVVVGMCNYLIRLKTFGFDILSNDKSFCSCYSATKSAALILRNCICQNSNEWTRISPTTF